VGSNKNLLDVERIVTARELVVSEDIALNQFTAEDGDAAYALVDNNRDFLAQSEPWAADFKPEVALTGCAFYEDANKKGTGAYYKIMHKAEFIDAVGLSNLEGRTATLGYWIAEAWQGKGIMGQAASRLLEYAHDHLELQTVTMNIAPDNTRSQQLATKLGAHKTSEETTTEGEEIWEISLGK
jgi:ribosomal-protein-serine acetyltransferase